MRRRRWGLGSRFGAAQGDESVSKPRDKSGTLVSDMPWFPTPRTRDFRTRQPRVFTEYLLFLLNNLTFSFCIIFLIQMAIYTENDVQNALANVRNGVALATAATRNGVPRNTLRGRLGGA